MMFNPVNIELLQCALQLIILDQTWVMCRGEKLFVWLVKGSMYMNPDFSSQSELYQSYFVRRRLSCVNISLKRLLLHFSSDFDQTWVYYDHWANVLQKFVWIRNWSPGRGT